MTFQSLKATGKFISFLILSIAIQLAIGPIADAKIAFRSTSTSSSAPDNSSLSQQPDSAAICPEQLPAAIEAIASRPQLIRARWGISIQTLSPSRSDSSLLYSRDAKQFFIPASNTKLFTTAAILHRLGSNYRIRTSVYGSEDLLRVVGRGDPSLTTAQLRDLARQIKGRGIRQVKQLIADDSYFQGQAVHPTWEWEDVYGYYGTAVNSLILNENAWLLTLLPQAVGQPLQVKWGDPLAALQWRVENESVTERSGAESSVRVSGVLGKPVLRIEGGLAVDSKPEASAVAIPDPGLHFLQQFRLALASEGITVARASVSFKATAEGEPELAAVESPPISALITQTNQPSNNLYAEALLRSLGATSESASVASQSSADKGLAAVKETLMKLGVDPAGYALADGSGLSRHNLVSPEALVQMLRAIAMSPQADIYRASLPVAGKSGTLQNRFRDPVALGIVQAKTGTMTGVVALSGYLDAPHYQPLVFSIIVNQSDLTATPLRQAVDEMVLVLTRLHRC